MSTERNSPRRRAFDARSALRSVPILADIGDEQLEKLAGALERRHVPADEWLFRVGEPSDAIYVIESGRFAVFGPLGQVFQDLASGDSVGELSVIAGAVRGAGVRALRDSVAWRMSADAFGEVLAANPKMHLVIFEATARMLRESPTANSFRRPHVIGVLSTGDAFATPIVEAIAARLGSHGQTAVVAPPVDITAGVDSYAELVDEFSDPLDLAERSNDWVLVVADSGSGDLWRRYVAAQCDRLVVLVDQPHPPENVGRLAAHRPAHLISCIQEPDPGWWDLLQPVSHHRDDDDGIAALVRRIAGRSLGLVLAGGGARGLAHFGVYEELTRAGVVIDRFGGTSAGALAAGTFAVGMSAEDAIALARESIAHSNPLGDYTIPAVSLIRGGRVDSLAERLFGNTLIEHLGKEFFAVSTDMISGEQIVHRRGSLSLAVRASMSIPGLMPPVQDGDRLLVDGGLLNNLPADLMCADQDGEVICVDLRQPFVPSNGFGILPRIIQPPGFVRRLVTGTDVALPPLQETLFRTVDLASSYGTLSELPRIAAIIVPDVSAIGLLDFRRIEEALEAGRIAARATLDAHPRLAA